MCVVRLVGSLKASKSRGTNGCLFIIAAYAPTNCSDDSVKNDFYRQLNELLRHRRSSDTVVLAGDLNAQVGRLSTDELQLGVQHGVGSRNDNEVKRETGLLKLNKAAGPDDLHPALFKFGGHALVDDLHELLMKLWEQETVPIRLEPAPLFFPSSKEARARNAATIVESV
ncbi:unnamed protein product [Dicrocoelium dendriticum]|nr:unnamed protein product [Dicrocoelium dendriticum]